MGRSPRSGNLSGNRRVFCEEGRGLVVMVVVVLGRGFLEEDWERGLAMR